MVKVFQKSSGLVDYLGTDYQQGESWFSPEFMIALAWDTSIVLHTNE